MSKRRPHALWGRKKLPRAPGSYEDTYTPWAHLGDYKTHRCRFNAAARRERDGFELAFAEPGTGAVPAFDAAYLGIDEAMYVTLQTHAAYGNDHMRRNIYNDLWRIAAAAPINIHTHPEIGLAFNKWAGQFARLDLRAL